MEKIIKGKAYVLGDNIDTDQIIPAEHLVYSVQATLKNSRKYGHYALSSVPINRQDYLTAGFRLSLEMNINLNISIVIGGSNFGCGSSREHAPLAMQVAGVKVVIAESYARIFFRNAVDGGFLFLMNPTKINSKIKTGDVARD
jgi:3-isopropylmalate/(R)-2-methylmalate dehydratase small subunit